MLALRARFCKWTSASCQCGITNTVGIGSFNLIPFGHAVYRKMHGVASLIQDVPNFDVLTCTYKKVKAPILPGFSN